MPQDMEEADYLCDRVAIIDHGKIIALDKPNNLKNAIGEDVISLQVSDCGKFSDILTKFEFIKRINSHDNFLFLSVENGEITIPRIMRLAHEEEVLVHSVKAFFQGKKQTHWFIGDAALFSRPFRNGI
jgi:ABC-2 type transport system ATP-binding protein